MARIDAQVEANLGPFRTAVELIMSILGIKSLSAQVIVSEIGIDMSRFPSSAHLISWACICPRNDESAGKRRSVCRCRGIQDQGRDRAGSSYVVCWVVSLGACRLLSKGERGNADSSPTQRAPHTSTQPGRHRPEPVVAIDRNRWSSSTETAGRHQPVCATIPN
jgi:hypothetical protein